MDPGHLREQVQTGSEAVLTPLTPQQSSPPPLRPPKQHHQTSRVPSRQNDSFKHLQILRKPVHICRSFPTYQLNPTIHRTPRTPSLFQEHFLYFLTEAANLRGRPKSQKRKRPVLPLGSPPPLLPRPLSPGPSQLLLHTTTGFSSENTASAAPLLLPT